MTSWKTYRLGDLCDTISDTYKGCADEVVLINTSDVLEGKCLNHTKEPNRNLKGQFKKTFKKYDILYSEIRPANKRFAYIDFDATNYIASTKLMVLRHNEKIESLYLYYILQSQSIIDELQMLAESRSGTFPQITFAELSRLEVKLPNREVQRQILGILGAIDDKIENNRRINTNLELQAQALYKQWFVDNRNDDWEEIKLGDIIEISKKSITPSQFENTIFEHYSLPAYDDGKQPTFDRGQDIKSSKFVINNGMFLFSKLNPYIKRIWFPNIGTEHAICSTEFIPYKPKRVDMLGLCYSIVNSEHFYDYVLSLTNGSTGSHQRFHPVDTLEYPLCIPSEKYIEKFESLVMPMYKEIALNRKENCRLATLRDTLLPKLMNGEIKL